jgi:hypothetical protein
MPWTAADASKHKKGLSATQARQWAHVANSALARCQEDGDSDCDGRAIRQANAAVDKMVTVPSLGAILTLTAEIRKMDEERQRIFGLASVLTKRDGSALIDLQGDVIAIEDMEDGWYGYVRESGELNFQHAGPVRGHLIEAMLFTPEKLTVLGLPADALPIAAWAGYDIPDPEDWALVKQHRYFMYSIEGSGLREFVDAL